MIIYFADRNLDIVGTASTSLPGGLRILGDEKTEDVDSGIKTFSCNICYDDDSRQLVNDAMKVGNFLLRSHNDENEFYTIIESENNTSEQEVSIYAEDAGLDLINTVASEYSASSTMTIQQYLALWLPAGWTVGINEVSGSLKLEWTSESTLTERLKSLASEFGAELSYSYEIDRLSISGRYINIHKKRGNQVAQEQLMLGRDISKIVVKSSVNNLATAYNCTGGTPNGKTKPINLSGCDYSSDGTTTHEPAVATDDYQIVGKKVVCNSAKERWASEIDTDGLLVRQYSYDTTDKKTLFSHAVAELKKVVDSDVTYDIELASMPAGVRLGDRVNIVDDKDELYLEGRILELTTSVTSASVKATFGEYLIRSSGISEQLQELARKVEKESAVSASTISITSTNGLTFKNAQIITTLAATIFYAGEVIDTTSELQEVYGASATVKWYIGNVQIGEGLSVSINSVLNTLTVTCKLIVDGDIATSEVTLQRVDDGEDGSDGEDGTTFTPSVDSSGNISWTNDGGKENPPTQNIKGPQGPAGSGTSYVELSSGADLNNCTANATVYRTASTAVCQSLLNKPSNMPCGEFSMTVTWLGSTASYLVQNITAKSGVVVKTYERTYSSSSWSSWSETNPENNHFWYDSDGAHVSTAEKSTTDAYNTLITSDGMNIQYGDTALASFGSDTVELGKNSADATIKLCGDGASITYDEDLNTAFFATSPDEYGNGYNATELYSEGQGPSLGIVQAYCNGTDDDGNTICGVGMGATSFRCDGACIDLTQEVTQNGYSKIDMSAQKINTSGDIYRNGHSTPVGTRLAVVGGTDYTTDLSSGTETWKTIAKITIPAGTWVVIYRIRYQNSSSGNHIIRTHLTSDSTSTAYLDSQFGAASAYLASNVTMFVTVTEETDMYLRGYSTVAGTWFRSASTQLRIEALRIL